MSSYLKTILVAVFAVADTGISRTVVPGLYSREPCPARATPAQERYSGTVHRNGNETRLRIGNGGAGQSGLVGKLAAAFIDWSREKRIANEDYLIDWVLGDTTASIENLRTGEVDIAITYNAAAEWRAGNLSISAQRVYGFRDHFLIAGPPANPAGLQNNDTIPTIFEKIVTTGNEGKSNPPTRFLSRFDKSATNMKESLLFVEVGQVPWAYPYSTWYHQYPQFPVPALTAASRLQEYTLTDRRTYLTLKSQNPSAAGALAIYKAGGDSDPMDPLLNPAAVLLGGKVCADNLPLAKAFMDWMVAPDGGQQVVKNFKQEGSDEYLYTPAPDCKAQPDHCRGW